MVWVVESNCWVRKNTKFVCGASEISRKCLILHIYSCMFMFMPCSRISHLCYLAETGFTGCLCLCVPVVVVLVVVGPDET